MKLCMWWSGENINYDSDEKENNNNNTKKQQHKIKSEGFVPAAASAMITP